MAAKKKTEADKMAETEVVEEDVASEATFNRASESPVSAPAEQKTEKKFPLENLAKNCIALFGISSCTFAGATAGLTGEFTVEELKSIIDKWCGKEIN